MANSPEKEYKDKIKEFLKDNQNKLLVILIAFVTLIRLYYFFKVGEQPIWWDEGDYLSVAKGLIYGWQSQEWWVHFTGIRPLLMPLIWALFFKLNISEIIIRFFTLLIPSVLTVYLTYAIGRDLYNKNIGLISGLMMSVYWVHMFYTFRLLTDIPAMLLGMLSLYFFWSVYIKKGKSLGLYLCVLFGVLGISTRFPLAWVTVTCMVYIIITKRLQILKDKTIWKAGIFGVILGVLYILIASILGSGLANAFKFYFGSEAVSMHIPIFSAFKNILFLIFDFSSLFKNSLMESIWTLTFFVGCITLINLIIGWDLFLKQKDKTLNSDFFVTLWIFMTLFLYIIIFRAANDRWLLILMPALFFISGKGILLIYHTLKKYNKEIAIFILVVLLFGGFYQNLNHTNKLIDLKKDTYNEEKLAGLWIKDNFEGNEPPKIMTASVVQIAYYSDGYTYGFDMQSPEYRSCVDIMGAVSTNETCQTITENLFNKKIKEINPDYLIIHVFEPVFTPNWVYSYPEKHRDILIPVQAYFADKEKTQPLLIVYKFK